MLPPSISSENSAGVKQVPGGRNKQNSVTSCVTVSPSINAVIRVICRTSGRSRSCSDCASFQSTLLAPKVRHLHGRSPVRSPDEHEIQSCPEPGTPASGMPLRWRTRRKTVSRLHVSAASSVHAHDSARCTKNTAPHTRTTAAYIVLIATAVRAQPILVTWE